MSQKAIIQELQAQIDSIESGTVESISRSMQRSQSAKSSDRRSGSIFAACDCESVAGELSRPNRASRAQQVSKGRAGYDGSEDDERDHEASEDANKAFKKIVSLVNVSDRSRKEIRNRLVKAGYTEEAIEEALERASSYRFIDDKRYADVLIRSRISQGKGSSGIERELAENDIDPAEVPGWPYEYGIDDESELQRALELLEKKPPRSKNQREGAFRRLMQKGYPTSVSSSAARIWSESHR